MRHPKVLAWEKKMKGVFDVIDHELEDAYGSRYPLHPARPPAGATANPETSGLFDVGAAFTPGFGSEHGAGYIVDIDMATLSRVPGAIVEEIEQRVVERLGELLPEAFPEQTLQVVRDGHRFKIRGDLTLGEV